MNDTTQKPVKVPRAIREAVLNTFEKMGGAEGMYRWAMMSYVRRGGRRIYPNLTKFYELAARLMPAEVLHNVEGTVYHAIETEKRNALSGPPPGLARLPAGVAVSDVVDAEFTTPISAKSAEFDPFGESSCEPEKS